MFLTCFFAIRMVKLLLDVTLTKNSQKSKKGRILEKVYFLIFFILGTTSERGSI